MTLFFSHSQPKVSRTIWHYQYLSWPDHGVPQEPGGVLSFLSQVNAKQDECPDAGPMIVHCRYSTADVLMAHVDDAAISEIINHPAVLRG